MIDTKTSLSVIIGRVLLAAVPLVIWFLPLGLSTPKQLALTIASFMIVAWITELFPYAVTGLIGCYLFWVLGVAKFNIAFAGFATESPWFCFSALLTGTAVKKSGLARRLSYRILLLTGNTYSRVILGFVLVSFLLTFLVPS